MMGRLCVLLMACLFLTGCDQVDQVVKAVVERHLASISAEIKKNNAETKQKIDNLTAENSALKQKITDLEFADSVTQSVLSTLDRRAATITDEGGYGIARTRHGPVIISMEKIEPYLDGYKVTLNIGNMTAATMRGAEFDVEWGLRYGAKNVTYQQILASKKKKHFATTNEFPSGVYTLFDVTLTPASPDEVKTIEVTPQWDVISLRRSTTPRAQR